MAPFRFLAKFFLFKHPLVRWGVGLGSFYLLLCAVLFWQQRRFIFVPTALIEETPANYQLPYEEVWLPISTPQNRVEKLHGWWIPAPSKVANTLLYCHGNGLNIGANVEQAQRFHRMGLSVFLFDYRGYGNSEGDFPSEATVYKDTQRAWDYLTQIRRIPPQHILLYGHSLGGAIAIHLATQQPKAAGLIVQSSFTSAVAMAQRNWWTAFFPTDWLLNQRFNSLERVPHLVMPTLYLHGTADALIPHQMSEQLYAATRSSKTLKLFPGAGHNNVAQVGGAAYTQAIQTFLKQAKPLEKTAPQTKQVPNFP